MTAPTPPAPPSFTFVPIGADVLGFKIVLNRSAREALRLPLVDDIKQFRNVGRTLYVDGHIEVYLRADWRVQQQRSALLAEVRKVKRLLQTAFGPAGINTEQMPKPYRRPGRRLEPRRRPYIPGGI